ncbi:MAG: helix-turn-helix transcriptional regulator [Acidimicrobiia bacterium]
MRADRLVAILLLLQTRGQVTALEVAAELEVSERTARRDLEALSMAGVPVYSTRGRNGGWQLIGGARTDLSGLNAAEARALFLVAGPSSSATPEVRAALRKLVRALPEPFREDAEAASSAVLVDPAGWGRRPRDRNHPPFLDALQSAVIRGEQVRLGYVSSRKEATTRIVHPLGLATKNQAWYLVADTEHGLRTFRVDRVNAVESTGAAVVRPPEFDLADAWRMVNERVDQLHGRARARGRVRGSYAGYLRGALGSRLNLGASVTDGWVEVEFGGPNYRSLAAEIAGFGAHLVIDEPAELVGILREIGRELVTLYEIQ